MAYDAPEAASVDLAGKAEAAAGGLPAAGANAPVSLDQVESANTPAAAPDHGVGGGASSDPTLIPGTEADKIQLDGPPLQGEEGTGLTGGPIGN